MDLGDDEPLLGTPLEPAADGDAAAVPQAAMVVTEDAPGTSRVHQRLLTSVFALSGPPLSLAPAFITLAQRLAERLGASKVDLHRVAAAAAALSVASRLEGREPFAVPGQATLRAVLGPAFDDVAIDAALKEAGLQAEQPDDLAARCARLIHRGGLVAWYQGPLEFGPRALGGRSILADPTRFDMRTRLNAKVKERESFRPFAPSVLAEDLGRHLVVPKDMDAAEYMLLALPTRERADAQRIPAVVQENGSTGVATSRIHVVRDEVNPPYARLLRELKRLSGLGMVLNTSFNISEPIVCTPQHAIRTWLRSKMDALAIGSFLVQR